MKRKNARLRVMLAGATAGLIFLGSWATSGAEARSSQRANRHADATSRLMAGAFHGRFNQAFGLTTDRHGNVFVADTFNNRIQKLSATGQQLGVWGTKGSGPGHFWHPYGLTLGHGVVYVADTLNFRIQKVTVGGRFLMQWKTRYGGNGNPVAPVSVSLDNAGNLYVVGSNIVQKYSSSGRYLAQWGKFGQFHTPYGVAVSSQGSVFIADTHADRILKYSAAGKQLAVWGSKGNKPGQFLYPYDVAVDAAGSVYVADSGNDRVEKFSPTGKVLAVWGRRGYHPGQFVSPAGIAVDNLGNVYVSDYFRIEKLSPSGRVLRVWM